MDPCQVTLKEGVGPQKDALITDFTSFYVRPLLVSSLFSLISSSWYHSSPSSFLLLTTRQNLPCLHLMRAEEPCPEPESLDLSRYGPSFGEDGRVGFDSYPSQRAELGQNSSLLFFSLCLLCLLFSLLFGPPCYFDASPHMWSTVCLSIFGTHPFLSAAGELSLGVFFWLQEYLSLNFSLQV